MGIPFYFSNISGDKSILLRQLNAPPDYLCFDFNCLIHTVAQHAARELRTRYKKPANLHKAIFSRIAAYTLALTGLVKPRLGTYVAVDGVPPLAKIVQQRKRRYMSVFEAEYRAKLGEGEAPTLWNSNIVTPGTKFMEDLHAHLHEAFTAAGLNIEYSSYEEPGEGEHKIFAWLAGKAPQVPLPAVLIYGLDADMIMLSMIKPQYRITLLREAQGADHSKPSLADFTLVAIDEVKRLMLARMGSPKHGGDACLDYVLLAALAGNDFVPPLSHIKVKRLAHGQPSGLDQIVHEYSLLGQPLVQGGAINWPALTSLLGRVAATEDEDMLRVHRASQRAPHRGGADSEEEYRYKHFPVLDPALSEARLVDPGRPGWRQAYKAQLFPRGVSMEEASRRYLLGLSWVLEYYVGNAAPAWEWFYDQCYSPTAQVVYNSLLAGPPPPSAREVYRLSRPITPLVQLAAVIPPGHAAALLPPAALRAQADPQVRHMFPTAFRVHTWLKTVAWECCPVLPPLSISLVAAAVERQSKPKRPKAACAPPAFKTQRPIEIAA